MNARGRHVCVGLDTDPARIPPCLNAGAPDYKRVVAFNSAIVEATATVACAYKPNAAFYEALGRDGFLALSQTVAAIRRLAPGIPVIIDAKRADIGNTNNGYVSAIFDQLGADAVTVHPYLGGEALRPFLDRSDRIIFVLARTSNPGAGEIQDMNVGGLPLYRHVARIVASDWNQHGNCGLVVGATYPAELAVVREDIPATMPMLIPGIGAQGGDLEAVIRAQSPSEENSFLINASRSVMYASSGPDFAVAAGAEAGRLDDQITALLEQSPA